MQAALAFDEATHTYTLDGARLPSVTQVISAVLPGWQASAWYMQRGLALHHGCRLFDEGRLDWGSVSPEIMGRVRAWQSFAKDVDLGGVADVILCERALAHPHYRYAGTVDRVLLANGAEIVADIKSTIEPQVRLQLGGYSLLLKQIGMKIVRGVAVELHDDGMYRTLWLSEAELRRAERSFIACLSLYGFQQEHGVK